MVPQMSLKEAKMDFKSVAGWIKENAVDAVVSDLIGSGVHQDRDEAVEAVENGLHDDMFFAACEVIFGLIRKTIVSS